MNRRENNQIVNKVKECYQKMSEFSAKADASAFLSYFDDSADFISISAEGKMNNYGGAEACSRYYNSIPGQSMVTLQEKYRIVTRDLVIVSWTGNIKAAFKNGDTVLMENYSVTNLFEKKDGNWKVIHDHESALPPEIIRGKP